MKHKRTILIDRIKLETGHMESAFSDMLSTGKGIRVIGIYRVAQK